MTHNPYYAVRLNEKEASEYLFESFNNHLPEKKSIFDSYYKRFTFKPLLDVEFLKASYDDDLKTISYSFYHIYDYSRRIQAYTWINDQLRMEYIRRLQAGTKTISLLPTNKFARQKIQNAHDILTWVTNHENEARAAFKRSEHPSPATMPPHVSKFDFAYPSKTPGHAIIASLSFCFMVAHEIKHAIEGHRRSEDKATNHRMEEMADDFATDFIMSGVSQCAEMHNENVNEIISYRHAGIVFGLCCNAARFLKNGQKPLDSHPSFVQRIERQVNRLTSEANSTEWSIVLTCLASEMQDDIKTSFNENSHETFKDACYRLFAISESKQR